MPHCCSNNSSKTRCSWCNLRNPLYVTYHDHEWGVPVYNDRKLFEMLLLECFQAGLSWECVLNKREAFRLAFDGFKPTLIAAYDSDKQEALRINPGIIRNKLKIAAAVANARAFLQIQQEFGSFRCSIWRFTAGKTIPDTGKTSTPLSDTVSSDLKKRGMKFVGTTIVYSYLQAIGVINSHDTTCYLHTTSV